jgi:hypothetical protein
VRIDSADLDAFVAAGRIEAVSRVGSRESRWCRSISCSVDEMFKRIWAINHDVALTCRFMPARVALCGSNPRSNDGQTIKGLIIFSMIRPLTWDFLSGWRDLNPRPLRPERSALPSCATPRLAAGSLPVAPPDEKREAMTRRAEGPPAGVGTALGYG